jgi:hypothetical protein
MISSKDAEILQEIVTLDGKCLSSKRCTECPFRSMCLPEFLAPTPLPQHKRAKMALNILSYNDLLDDDDIIEQVKSAYGYHRDSKK